MRIVLHIDMDAFFAAIEERDKPRLKGLPIIVGADPHEGKGRGVVSTANYKAREYGIRSAMPISSAWRLSEEAFRKGLARAVFVGGNYERYGEVSREIMEYLKTQSEKFEQASVDEAFLEVTATSDLPDRQAGMRQGAEKDLWSDAILKAKEIKEHIKKNQKLTCSIGIGPNKLIAKIAAGREKPDGLTIVKPDDVQAFLDPLSIREIPGIGPKSGGILAASGVKTINDLRSMPKEELMRDFGKQGESMWRKAQGIDESPVSDEYETKSIGEQVTFDNDTLNPNFLMERLKIIAKTVAGRVAKEGFAFRTVSIIVRFENFDTRTRAHTLAKTEEGAEVIEREAIALFLPFLDSRENPNRKKIRLLGIRVEKLSLAHDSVR